MTKELKRRFADEALEVARASEEFLRVNVEKAESFINIYSVPEFEQKNASRKN